MPTLLYIGQNPAIGMGSPIIVLRHLRRFAAAGWNIAVLADYGGDYRLCREEGWTVVDVCHRRWWWPPYRPGSAGLRWLRLRLLAREAAAVAPAPDVVLNYLAAHTGFNGELATHVAQLTGAPLHVLVHDDPAAFPSSRGREHELRQEYERILRGATACWFVSPELADCFPGTAGKRRVLYPMPEGWERPAVWRDRGDQPLRIYYAGHVWPEQVPLLGRIARTARQSGSELVVMAQPSDALRSLTETEGVPSRPALPNRDALAVLTDEASGLVVSYADDVDAMPWCASSFPSKLVEYCHLGIPILIVSPEESSVARWAKRVRFPGYFAPTDEAGIRHWLAGLRTRRIWEERAAFALRLARSEFDPVRIQADLANGLLPGTEQRAA